MDGRSAEVTIGGIREFARCNPADSDHQNHDTGQSNRTRNEPFLHEDCPDAALGGAALLVAFTLAHPRLTVILDTHASDEIKLCLEEIDVLLLGLEDGFKQLTRHVVLE
jgi:hypothetical protein